MDEGHAFPDVAKVIALLSKSYSALPVATDLPRLTHVKLFDLSGRNILYPSFLQDFIHISDSVHHDNSNLKNNFDNRHVVEKMATIFAGLTNSVDSREEAEHVYSTFINHFLKPSNNINSSTDESSGGPSSVSETIDQTGPSTQKSFTEVTKTLMEEVIEAIGGDNHHSVQILKAINQSAISPAIIFLKLHLGLTNMTKDVRDSWHFEIYINVDNESEIDTSTVPIPSTSSKRASSEGQFSPSRVRVISRKKDACIQGTFEYGWFVAFDFKWDAQTNHYNCINVVIGVSSLVFSPTAQDSRKKLISNLLLPYMTQTCSAAFSNMTSTPEVPLNDVPIKTNSHPINSSVDGKSSHLESFERKNRLSASLPNNITSLAPQPESSATPTPVFITKIYDNGDRYEGWMKRGIRHGEGTYFYFSFTNSSSPSESGVLDPSQYQGIVTFKGNFKDGVKQGPGVLTFWLPELKRASNSESTDSIPPNNNSVEQQTSTSTVPLLPNGDQPDQLGSHEFLITPLEISSSISPDKGHGSIEQKLHHGPPEETQELPIVGEDSSSVVTTTGPISISPNIKDNSSPNSPRFVECKLQGEFSNGELTQGKYTLANGDIYEGEFSSNKYNGRGKYSTSDGDEYEGCWKHGCRHGEGVLRLANGDWYEGEWYQDCFHGYGKYSFTSLSHFYKGQFAKGQMHGVGEYTFLTSGDLRMTVIGHFTNNQLSTPLSISPASSEQNTSNISHQSNTNIKNSTTTQISDAQSKLDSITTPESQDASPETSKDFKPEQISSQYNHISSELIQISPNEFEENENEN